MHISNKLNTALSLLMMFMLFGSVTGQTAEEKIRINQLGFYPNAPKVAVVTGKTMTDIFYVTSTNLRDTFFQGSLKEEKKSLYSSTVCRMADFSKLTRNGSYVINLPGVGHSYIFTVGPDVHRGIAESSLKGFYYQRCSMRLESKFAGKWHRSAGHPDTAVYIHPSAAGKNRPAGTKISTPGGWYDAGDYNKYMVNSGISMGTLLSAYEDHAEYFNQLQTKIPESGNGIPDILNECIYNLRWMLSMQDPNDGGVYNKCTNAAFDGMVMPGVTTLPRYVVQKGTAATLDLVAVAAQAARILKQFPMLKPLADSCLNAAKKGWGWGISNPSIIYDQDQMNKNFQPAITTGGYGDRWFEDEWFWAASEMLITFKDPIYYKTFKDNYSSVFSVPSWNNVRLLGVYSLIRNKAIVPSIAVTTVNDLGKLLIQFSDSLIRGQQHSSYGTVIGQSTKDFTWGSNAVAANQSIVLLNAYKITHDKRYLDFALTNLDYLLGRNGTGYCFLTGAGSKPVLHPHHRQSVSDGVFEPVPGLLAGGVNPGRQDGVTYELIEPETAYIDKSEAYACNEIAINWNAPFVYLVAAIEALQGSL